MLLHSRHPVRRSCPALVLAVIFLAGGVCFAGDAVADNNSVMNHPELGPGHFSRVKDALSVPTRNALDKVDPLPDEPGLGRLTILTRVKGMLRDQSFHDAQSLWTSFRKAYESHQAGIMTPAGIVEAHVHENASIAAESFLAGLRNQISVFYQSPQGGEGEKGLGTASSLIESVSRMEDSIERIREVEERMRQEFRRENDQLFRTVHDLMAEREVIKSELIREKAKVHALAARELEKRGREMKHKDRVRVTKQMHEKLDKLNDRYEKMMGKIEEKLSMNQKVLGASLERLEGRIEEASGDLKRAVELPSVRPMPAPKPQG